jgi:hypothetical protein
VNGKCGIKNSLNRKHEPVTCFSTLSREVSIVFSFYIEMATRSIIMDASMTCSWCMSRCHLVASLTGVERTTPFEMCGISTFKTLILATSVISSISCLMRIIRLSRCARKGSRRDNNLNPLWFFDPLSKIRSSNCLDVALDFMPNHPVTFVNLVGLFQQCHSLFS